MQQVKQLTAQPLPQHERGTRQWQRRDGHADLCCELQRVHCQFSYLQVFRRTFRGTVAASVGRQRCADMALHATCVWVLMQCDFEASCCCDAAVAQGPSLKGMISMPLWQNEHMKSRSCELVKAVVSKQASNCDEQQTLQDGRSSVRGCA